MHNPFGAVLRVAPPQPAYALRRPHSKNAEPSSQADLHPATNLEVGFQGYDRMEELMREELAAVERCSPPKL